jgi:hypothetical protein
MVVSARGGQPSSPGKLIGESDADENGLAGGERPVAAEQDVTGASGQSGRVGRHAIGARERQHERCRVRIAEEACARITRC